ncbi:MAG: flagellar type III secretion system pore protein FliP [Rhodobacteraceae bacterium]|nr:flagellar type III secretion system pore protein FliP [Paracoccaceae bacterium]
MNRLAVLACAVIGIVLAATPALAQEITIDLGNGASLEGRVVQLLLLLTVISLAPGLAIMITCFPFIVTVLSILRQGIGLQQAPPNMLIISLALFLTYFIMAPVFEEAWTLAVVPLTENRISLQDALSSGFQPFSIFMQGRVDPDTYARLFEIRFGDQPPQSDTPPPSILVPSFLLSEISRAFQVGFLIFLPFLIIDLVVAAVLMSMGMMMVPPAIVSLPFKLAFFVVADGWTLVSEALIAGYF